MIVVTIDLAARPPATAIDNSPPYTYAHVSWGGCYGVGSLCRSKLTEEIEVAQDVRRIDANLRVRTLSGEFLLSDHRSATASLVISLVTIRTLFFE